jgi:hypothetical protein
MLTVYVIKRRTLDDAFSEKVERRSKRTFLSSLLAPPSTLERLSTRFVDVQNTLSYPPTSPQHYLELFHALKRAREFSSNKVSRLLPSLSPLTLDRRIILAER